MADKKQTITNEKIFDYMKSGFEMVMAELVDLKERMDRNEHQIHQINVNQKDTNKRLAGMKTGLGKVEKRLNSVDNRLGKVEDKLDTVGIIVKDHEKRIVRLETLPL